MDKLPDSKYFNTKPLFTSTKRYYNSLQIDKPKPLAKKQANNPFKKSTHNDKTLKLLIENRDILEEKELIKINEVYQIGKMKGKDKKYV